MELSTVYGADPRRTIELLEGIARSIDGVSFAPAPQAIMTGLTAGTLDFSIRAWTTDRADWVQVRSELAMRIRDALAEAGIDVPLPQHEVRLHSMFGNGADLGQNVPPSRKSGNARELPPAG